MDGSEAGSLSGTAPGVSGELGEGTVGRGFELVSQSLSPIASNLVLDVTLGLVYIKLNLHLL